MPAPPEATCYTLSCHELRLFIEFTLDRGEFGRIGSSPEMEISLPLMGLADEECAISLDESGSLWLFREGKEHPVLLEPPSYFRAGPYRFLVREKVDVPANPVSPTRPTEPMLVETPSLPFKRRSPNAAIAVVAIGCVAAAVWLTVQNSKSNQVSSPPAPLPRTESPQLDSDSKPSLEVATKTKEPASDPWGPKAEPIKINPPAVQPPPTPEAVPKESDRIDLERLAKIVGPCVFRVEVIDEAGMAIGSGTGFAVSSDGLVTTNFHVVEHGAKFALITQQGARFDDAQVVAEDPSSDLAVLKIESKDLPFLKLAATSEVPVGKRVAVFGSPKGLGGTLSEGIISATPRDLKERFPNELPPNGGVLLQTTAPVSHGSSGSPLFDSDGQVIGVMTVILQGADQPQNLNFAVPVEALKPLIPKSGFQWPFFRRHRAEPGATTELKVPDNSNERSKEAPLADPAYRELRAKMDKQEWVEAMKLAGPLVEKYPKSAYMHYAHACCASALRLDRQAELSYLKVLEIVPKDAAVWHNLGIAIANQNQTERSLGAFERAVALKPDAASSWSQIVIGNVLTGNWAKATLAFTTLDGVDPTASKDLARFLSRFRLSDAGFRQALAQNLSKKLGNIAKDGPVRVRVVGVGANDTLSVRSGPGATFSIVTAVANGAEMFLTGRSEVNGTTEWAPVEDGNWAGWVAARFLAPIE